MEPERSSFVILLSWALAFINRRAAAGGAHRVAVAAITSAATNRLRDLHNTRL